MKHLPILAATLLLAAFATPCALAQSVPSKGEESMFRKGFDMPVGIPHGTWDFDEWPGVDHPVVYKQNYMYNSFPTEKIKIDYFLSVFDANDHEGYLKLPDTLRARGFTDFTGIIKSKSAKNKTMLGIFCHPDDEVLLAGGLLSYAAANGWRVKVILLSNGADGAEGQSDAPSSALGGYNSFGITADGKTVVKNDVMGERKLDIIKKYANELGVPVEVMSIDLTVDGKKVVQLGEAPGLDFPMTFGTASPYRAAIFARLKEIINAEKPAIILGHGKDGEYANYLHKMAHDLTIDAAREYSSSSPVDVYTCFPEYNHQDRITHFVDLNLDKAGAWIRKWSAIKNISFLYKDGNDYDKPWDPNDTLMDGAFVKDYGFTPETGEPPRYEFFQKVNL